MERGAPVKVLGAEAASDGTTVRLPDGRTFLDANVIIPEEQVEEIRTGYRCIRCMEPTRDAGAFPETCPSALPSGQLWCNFPMRVKQASEFAAMYKGTVKVGSRVDLNDEITRMTEMDEYENRTGIVIPDHVKFPTS